MLDRTQINWQKTNKVNDNLHLVLYCIYLYLYRVKTITSFGTIKAMGLLTHWISDQRTMDNPGWEERFLGRGKPLCWEREYFRTPGQRRVWRACTTGLRSESNTTAEFRNINHSKEVNQVGLSRGPHRITLKPVLAGGEEGEGESRLNHINYINNLRGPTELTFSVFHYNFYTSAADQTKYNIFPSCCKTFPCAAGSWEWYLS